uniref:Myosin motor domain-containing protein n=1 Tax=Noctiluca scintillans TaxID=2966 RepID=A0A7S1A0D6_NOCSC
MDELKLLNMAEVLDNVDLLFQQPQVEWPGQGPNTIYSSAGPVLIAMNPFKFLPMYDQQWVLAYHGTGKGHNVFADVLGGRKLGPHIYLTAEESYRGLMKGTNQSIVICGESGAGKTFTVRQMLKYLCTVAKSFRADHVGADPEKITMSNELAESFGNAKTTRNHNSSRFGKFTRLFAHQEDGKFAVCGCGSNHYLLERSRIVGAPTGERNYHIFYQLLRSGEAEKYKLTPDPKAYAYTEGGCDETPPGVDDCGDFHELVRKMDRAGFDEGLRKNIFEAVAAVLLLGNVQFTGDRDASQVSPSDDLDKACAMLGIDKNKLCHALTHQQTRDVTIEKEMGLDKAKAQRDSVAKITYSRMFDFVITTIDKTLRGAADGSGKEPINIGILDIFGFEDMAVNGFEQMFINLANERVQHLFNTIMFEREQSMYESEGIESNFLPLPSNIECVQMFTTENRRPRGIVALLTEACQDNRDVEEVDGPHFVSVLNRNLSKLKHFSVIDFKKVNDALTKKGLRKRGAALGVSLDFKECFGIAHYAGDVLYTVQNFIPKSRNAVTKELEAVLRASTKPVMKSFFELGETVQSTVGEIFTKQLEELVGKLGSGDTLFVRCVKTNPLQEPDTVDRKEVLEQLVRGGVVAALEMRQAGLPYHLEYSDFREEFGILERGSRSTDDRQCCINILRTLRGPEEEARHQFKFGKTKVFMKAELSVLLYSLVRLKTNYYCAKIQRKLCTMRFGKVTKCWDDLKETTTLIQREGFAPLKTTWDNKDVTLGELLESTTKLIDPVMKALDAARAKYGEKGMMKDIGKAMKPHLPAMSTMLTRTAHLKFVARKFFQRKNSVKGVLHTRVSRALTAASAQLSILAEVHEECDACKEAADPTELRKFLVACATARAKFETLKNKELPALLRYEFDFSKIVIDGPDPFVVFDPCPELDGLLEDGDQLVKEAQELAYDVLSVRRTFEACVSDLCDKFAAKSALLDELRSFGELFISAGLGAYADKISLADKMLITMDRIKIACKDGQAYRQCAKKFFEAVDEASMAVEEGQVELERIERERADREHWIDRLDDLKVELDSKPAQLKASMEKIITFDNNDGNIYQRLDDILGEVLPKIKEYRQVGWTAPLADWMPKVKGVVEQTSAKMEDITTMVRQKEADSKAVFQSRKALFKGK